MAAIPEGPDTRDERSRAWELGLVAVVALLYGRTVGFGWVYDDQMEIVRNTHAHSLANLRLIFTTTVWAGSGMETYLYRPLAVLSYALNHAASGLAAWSYHLVNVALHAGVTVLVFRLARRWGLGALGAGMGALLFAVHPVHVEVVANVAGRKDLLAALFVLGMLAAHRRGVQGGSTRGWAWTMGAAAAYLAACLSKEVGVVGLLLVAAQDVYLEGGVGTVAARRGLRLRYGVYVLVLLAFLGIRSGVTGGVSVPQTFYYDNPLVAVGAASGLTTAVVVVGKGVALLAAPLTLSPDYSFDAIPVVTSPLDVRLWGSVLGLGALLWLLGTGRARGTVLPLAVAWYVVTVLPTANLLVRVGTIFGERLLYLPSVAFCVAAGGGLAWLMGRYRAEGRALGGVLLAALALQSWQYTGAWTDDVSLFRWATAAVPRSTKAHHKLGEELLRRGELGPALRALDRALDIAPDNEFAAATRAQARAEVFRRYVPGVVSATPGVDTTGADTTRADTRGADTTRADTTGVGPGVSPETRMGPDLPADPDILYVLGQRARELGDLGSAEEYWLQALASDAHHGPSLADLGVLSLIQGDTARALERLQGAVESRPSLVSGWFNLGRVHLAQGRLPEARRALQRFVDEAGPRHPSQVAWARGVLAELSR